MDTRTLRTKALDNHGHSYDVVLTETDHPGYAKSDWVLHISGTPGQWYMTTLEERPQPGAVISIDFGQNWDCINFDAVLAEAKALLAQTDRLTATETKAHEADLWARLAAKR